MTSKLLALVLLAASTLNASAVLVAYDGFDYTDPSVLNGSAGGSGFAGSWVTTTNTVVSTPLTSTSGSLQVSANGVSLAGPASNDTDYRTFADRAGTDTWISFLYRRTATLVNGFTGIAIGSGTAGISSFSGTTGLFIGQWGPIGNLVMGVNDLSGIGISLGVGSTGGVTYHVVIELDYTSATGGTLRGYVNPTPGAGSPGSASGSISFTLNNLDRFGFETNLSDAVRIDEIRIGDTYSDVSPLIVPEPTTAALCFGAAGLLLLARRRRQE